MPNPAFLYQVGILKLSGLAVLPDIAVLPGLGFAFDIHPGGRNKLRPTLITDGDIPTLGMHDPMMPTAEHHEITE